MQDGFFASYHQGMPSIMPPLKTHHSGGLIGQQVDDLAFAFITPLRAKHDDIFAHSGLFSPFKSQLAAKFASRLPVAPCDE